MNVIAGIGIALACVAIVAILAVLAYRKNEPKIDAEAADLKAKADAVRVAAQTAGAAVKTAVDAVDGKK